MEQDEDGSGAANFGRIEDWSTLLFERVQRGVVVLRYIVAGLVVLTFALTSCGESRVVKGVADSVADADLVSSDTNQVETVQDTQIPVDTLPPKDMVEQDLADAPIEPGDLGYPCDDILDDHDTDQNLYVADENDDNPSTCPTLAAVVDLLFQKAKAFVAVEVHNPAAKGLWYEAALGT